MVRANPFGSPDETEYVDPEAVAATPPIVAEPELTATAYDPGVVSAILYLRGAISAISLTI